MTRRLIKHPLKVDPAYREALKAAWKRLDERGQKQRVQDAADITRMTAHRIMTGDDGDAGYDTIESLRLAINEELKEEVLPPAFTSIRSTPHSRACDAARDMDARGQLESLDRWILLGRSLSEFDIWDDLVDAVGRRLESERQKLESSNDIEPPKPVSGGSRSDRRATKGHG